ncbi:PAS domain S-box-containing protein [Azospirillum lipoferum]|uniref:histidine kinase n=1 Tax=Azospirillum lipoferum TaxID=193 RepID=A0A5A9G121_AZOLI|nr:MULTISPECIES: cache domain-containing protein [Azospirillum]KAA0587947.1 HAMP domain-containing protein [Azospirillum lipoferum]MCP1612215.1 PAS domain S-box-containing protein [Azospirillum lipoferum]MDW5536563.1 cache domain-containing protein [Azospirillum sp. NL1]
MIRSPLFLRLFSAILISLGLFSAAAYVFSVPFIEEKAYEIERDASRTILDNVFELVSRIRGGLEEQRVATVDSYKTRLRDVLELAVGYIEHVHARADRGEITMEQARREAMEGLHAFRYGNGDYVWAIGYDSVILSHPSPDYQGRKADDLRDNLGRHILPTIIATAKREGEGFQTYPWWRPNGDERAPKLSFFKDLPRRGIIVGTGAYLADVDAEVERRKAEAIEDLRQALRKLRIARTGYLYIFDSANRMIIHPNANIEGTAFGDRLNSATGNPIAEDLKVAAAKGEPLTYLWDKPDDPGNYAYEKISWVRHFEGFDWYIASSVYVDELRRSSVVLGNRILAIGMALMAAGSLLGYVAVGRLVRPLRRLADTAAQVRAGDLGAQSGIRRGDEIGLLASAFDGMVRQLRDTVATLDSRVRDRTAALAEAETRQRVILDAIPACIAGLDRDGRLTFANLRWAELVGRDKADVICRDLAAVVGRRAMDALAPNLDRCLSGEVVTFEYAFPRYEGTMVTKTTLIPHRGEGQGEGLEEEGTVTGLFVLTLDITDEKQTERQLVEAQRLKAVGQLSGGLAHDFNNLLSIIIGNLSAARDRYAAVEGLDAYLEPAQRAGRRGADITARLLAFSRQQPLKPEPIELCGLLRDMAVLLRRSFPSSIAIGVPEEGRDCWTIADQTQLENALVNLAINARDAMPGGGRLDIAVGIRKLEGDQSFDEPVRPDDYLEIRVSDTGTGFTAEALARAVEPFFTTKALGSGLGLSMVYGFVKQSRGYLRIDSRPGQGTTVTLLLPRAEPAPRLQDADPVAADPQPADWSGQLALVAEDNDDVRQVMRQQLVDLGFSVVEAGSGDEAVELVEQIDGLSLLVSDIVMPSLSGVELARRARLLRPAMRVVLVSGFAVEYGDVPADAVILRKPWDKRELVAAIGHATEPTPA